MRLGEKFEARVVWGAKPVTVLKVGFDADLQRYGDRDAEHVRQAIVFGKVERLAQPQVILPERWTFKCCDLQGRAHGPGDQEEIAHLSADLKWIKVIGGVIVAVIVLPWFKDVKSWWLGSAMAGARLGIEPQFEQNAAYLDAWIKVLRSEKYAVSLAS